MRGTTLSIRCGASHLRRGLLGILWYNYQLCQAVPQDIAAGLLGAHEEIVGGSIHETALDAVAVRGLVQLDVGRRVVGEVEAKRIEIPARILNLIEGVRLFMIDWLEHPLALMVDSAAYQAIVFKHGKQRR